MPDGSSRKLSWRRLAPDLDKPVSPEVAAVLVLHHLELAAAFFGALDLDYGEDEDPLAGNLRSNQERFALVMAHLNKRYPDVGNDKDFQAAVPAFLNAINDHWDAVWREEYASDDNQGEG